MKNQKIITPSAANVSTVVGDLRERSAKWEQGALASSNAELYVLLAAAYAVYDACRINAELTDGLATLMYQHNLTHTKRTALALKVVRLVFATGETQNKHKYRHLAYACVLELAAKDNVKPEGLPKYIEDKGGIDEIRRGATSGSNGTAKNQLTQVAKVQLGTAEKTMLISSVDFSDRLKPAHGERFFLALIRADGDGKGSIVYGINNPALVDRALELAGKDIREQVAKQAEQDLMNNNLRRAETGANKSAVILTTALSKKTSVTTA